MAYAWPVAYLLRLLIHPLSLDAKLGEGNPQVLVAVSFQMRETVFKESQPRRKWGGEP